MKPRYLFTLFAILAMWLLPRSASAISGTYSDRGGGTYWCNVYVAEVSHGKSYKWCTGIEEEVGMNNFRGFETDYGGKLSTQRPTVLIKYRHHYGQPNGWRMAGFIPSMRLTGSLTMAKSIFH